LHCRFSIWFAPPAQANPLRVADTAGEHIEQDAAIEHPGNERAVGTGEFYGAALYYQPPTKYLQKISGRLSCFAPFRENPP